MSRELLQQALDKFEHLWEIGIDAEYKVDLMPEIRALRAELAKPEQTKYSDIVSDGGLDPRNKFDAQPEQEQEPVAWLVSDAQGRYATIRDPSLYKEEVYEPLYAAPPRKPWQGLTAEEIFEITERLTKEGGVNCDGWIVAVEVQQKLKEKNGAL